MSSRERREFLDWSLPSARDRLQVGNILETYDCGYIAVKEITADGIVQGNTAAAFTDHFWTWEKLNLYSCCIIAADDDAED